MSKTNKRTKGRHSKKNPNWGTPADLCDLIRSMFDGRIDLDPFSSVEQNEKLVRAERIWTFADDGFKQDWNMDAGLVNHPGGTTKRSWAKACAEITAGRAKRFAWIGFSVEQLCVLAEPGLHPTDFTHVFVRKRIDFIDGATGLPGGSPSHSNYLCFPGVSHKLVEEYFGGLHHPYVGRVVRGRLSVD